MAHHKRYISDLQAAPTLVNYVLSQGQMADSEDEKWHLAHAIMLHRQNSQYSTVFMQPIVLANFQNSFTNRLSSKFLAVML